MFGFMTRAMSLSQVGTLIASLAIEPYVHSGEYIASSRHLDVDDHAFHLQAMEDASMCNLEVEVKMVCHNIDDNWQEEIR